MKMKKKILWYVSIVLTINTFAQVPSVAWVAGADGNEQDNGYAIACGPSGNYYVTGYYNSDSIRFGNTTLYLGGQSSSSISNVFLVKYDSNGNVIWAKSGFGNGLDRSNCIAVDSSENIYIAGHYSGRIQFNNDTLNSVGGSDMFIVKYDRNGNVIWTKSYGGINYDEIYGIAADAFGNLFFTGYYSGLTFVFGNDTLHSIDFSSNALTGKIDANGNEIWARIASGTKTDNGRSVTIDNNNNVYVVGLFNSRTLNIESISIQNSDQLQTPTTYDFFIIKYSNHGNVIWAKREGGPPNDDYGYSIKTDLKNNLYVSTKLKSISTIGSFTVSPGTCLIKYDSLGTVIYVKRAVGLIAAAVNYVTTDANNNVYLCGIISTTNPFTFGTDTLFSNGAFDGYIVKFDSIGNELWMKSIGGNQMDYTNTLAMDSDGNIVLTGMYSSNGVTTCGGEPLLINTNPLNGGMYLVKLSNSISVETEELTKNKPNELFKLSPNPNNGLMQLQYQIEQNSIAHLSIYNVLGEKVSEYKLQNNSNLMTINETKLTSGIYFYTIYVNDFLLKTDKIIIGK
jgi:Secretion system C-terminal sorting domain/Beta-propeller repeat